MAKRKGLVEIQLDKKRNLKFNFNAICNFEEATGKSIASLGETKEFKMSDLRALLWAGLVHEDPDLTIEEAGELFDYAESFQYVSEKITEAVNLGINGGNEGKGK